MKNFEKIGHVIVVSNRSMLYLRFRKFIIYNDTYKDKPLLRILNIHGFSCGIVPDMTNPHENLYSNYLQYVVKTDTKAGYFDVSNIEVYKNEKTYIMAVYQKKQ